MQELQLRLSQSSPELLELFEVWKSFKMTENQNLAPVMHFLQSITQAAILDRFLPETVKPMRKAHTGYVYKTKGSFGGGTSFLRNHAKPLNASMFERLNDIVI
eukprot:IDg23145t1